MQNRIFYMSGVLRVPQSLVIDKDDLWQKYECDHVAVARGYDVQHFSDDMALRYYYETDCRNAPEKKRIMIVDHASFRISYDIAKVYQIIPISLNKLFPMLDVNAMCRYPGLDMDHLACIANMLPAQKMTPSETRLFCAKGMNQGEYAEDFGSDQLDKAVILAEKAVSHQDWTPIAKAFGKASMIQHSGVEIEGFLEGKRRIESAFEKWIPEHYSKLSGSVDTRRPVLLNKVNDFIRKGNQKVALIVMDGMSFENYYTIKRMIVDEPFSYDEEASFSFYPTVTAVARQSIFSGKLPLEHEKPFSLDNEEKQWTTYWKEYGYRDNEIAFFNTKEEITIPLQTKVVGIVIGICDQLMHEELQGLEGLRQGIENWVRKKQLVRLLQQLLDRGFAVFMTSDHGNTSAVADGRFKKPGVLAEPASRRAVIYQSYTDALELEKFSVIKFDGTYLPDEYTPYLFEDGVCYGDKGTEYITHGGMTLEETIVPFIRIGEVNG